MKKIIFPIAALALTLTASCSKEKVVAPAEQNNPPKFSTMSASGFNSLQLNSGMREWVESVGRCSSVSENCHPEDIVISKPRLSDLRQAISVGSSGIANLFSDDAVAKEYFPEWDSAWFVDVKTAILSGDYTFLEVGTSTFLFGKTGELTSENFDYVVQFAI